MFLTREERPSVRDSAPAEGVRITFPSDVKHWFPGPEQTALALARIQCPEDLYDHPGTTIEFGERIGRGFLLKRHIRGPSLALSGDPREICTILTPEVRE